MFFSPLLFVLIIAVCDDFIRCINLVSLSLQFAAGDDEGSGGDVPVVHLAHTRTGAA